MTDVSLAILRDAVAAAAKAGAQARNIIVRPGTVQGVGVDEILAEVRIDGDDLTDSAGDDVAISGVTGAQIVLPTGLQPGDRVLVMFVPPSGAYIIGRLAGDFEDWTYVGEVDPDGTATGPAFGAGWTNVSSNGLAGEDAHCNASYRRTGRFVELRGRVWRTSGGSNIIFVLPNDYCPLNRVVKPVVGGVGGSLGINYVGIETSGNVVATTLTPIDEPGGSVFLDGVIFSTDIIEYAEVP